MGPDMLVSVSKVRLRWGKVSQRSVRVFEDPILEAAEANLKKVPELGKGSKKRQERAPWPLLRRQARPNKACLFINILTLPNFHTTVQHYTIFSRLRPIR